MHLDSGFLPQVAAKIQTFFFFCKFFISFFLNISNLYKTVQILLDYLLSLGADHLRQQHGRGYDHSESGVSPERLADRDTVLRRHARDVRLSAFHTYRLRGACPRDDYRPQVHRR